jgi:hypothetical protein
MDYLAIKNRADLKNEILRLEVASQQQAEVLKAHFSSPSAIFKTIYSLFSSTSDNEDENTGSVFKQDFLGIISRFVLPLTLNKTLFRNSNFFVKALVGLASQKASHYISEDAVSNVWHKVRAAFDEHSGGIIDKVKSLFESKHPQKATNHLTRVPAQRNALKSDL